MRRFKYPILVAVVSVGVILLAVGVSQQGRERRRGIEQKENARMWELRERKRDSENYWHLTEAHRPATAPLPLGSEEAAELAELERRAAVRAADRAGSRR